MGQCEWAVKRMFWIGIIIGIASWGLFNTLLGFFSKGPIIIERFLVCDGKVLYIREEIKSLYPSIATRTVNDTGIRVPWDDCSLIEIPPRRHQETLELIKEAVKEEA